MNGALCLMDSNILIRWVQPSGSEYPVIEAALEKLARRDVTLCYTSQNLAEFWSACTRPTTHNGYGLSPEEADRRAQFFEARLRLLPDSLLVHEEWRRLLVAYRVSGVKVHDTRLAASMYVHGVKQILRLIPEIFRDLRALRHYSPGRSGALKFLRSGARH